MANIFIDTTLGTGSNDGTSTDNAYLDSGGLNRTFTGENYVWIRRVSNFTLAANISIASASAYQSANTKISLWPRPSRAFTGTWVQGERVISGVSGLTPKLTSHGARLVKNDADAKYYLITAIAVKIVFSSVSQAFAKYETITSSGGAVGKIMRWDSGNSTAWVVVKSGTFASSETVTGDGKVQEGVSKTAGAGTIGSVTAADGFVILQDYAGTSETGGNSTIAEDDLYSIAQAIDDSSWTIKLSTWSADDDDLPVIYGSTSAYRTNINSDYSRFYGIEFYGGGGSPYGLIYFSGFLPVFKHCIIEPVNNYHGITCSSNPGAIFIDSLLIGSGSGSTQTGLRSLISNTLIRRCAIYNMGDYGLYITCGAQMENVNVGVELDNGDQDIQNQNGIIQGFDVQCGGKNGTLRTSTADASNIYTGISNWQRVLGANIRKISNAKGQFIVTGSDPGTPPSGASVVYKLSTWESANYKVQFDILGVLLQKYFLYLSAGSHTIKVYLQNNGCGNINSSDNVDSADIWLEVVAAEQRVSDNLYYIAPDNSENYKRGTSSVNPIPNRGSASDWDDYLTISVTLPTAQAIIIRLKSRMYVSSGELYFDVVPNVT